MGAREPNVAATAFDEMPLERRQIATESLTTIVRLVMLDGLWTAELERRGPVGPQERDKQSLRQIGRETITLLSALRTDVPQLLGMLDGHESEFDGAFRAALTEFPASDGVLSELMEVESFAAVFRVACLDVDQQAAEAQDEIQERLIQMERGDTVAADFGPKFWCNLIAVGLGAGTLAGTIATAGVATPVILAALGVVVAEVGVIRTFGCWESLVRRVKAAT